MDSSRTQIIPARLARLRAHMEETRLGNTVVRMPDSTDETTEEWEDEGAMQSSREPHFIKRSGNELPGPNELKSPVDALMRR